jgi:hypothetical protein
MSTTEQKETEYIAGTITGIVQKGADKWQVVVQPDGSQYTKNLWSKDAELVAALSEKIGAHGAFVCGVSHWTNNEGKPVRSLWIDSASEEKLDDLHIDASVTQSAAKADAPRPSTNSGEGMTPEKWDAKERRDYRSRAWAQTIAAFTHTIKTDEKPEDVFSRLQPFQRKVFEDICGMFAYPADSNDVPF